MYRRISIEFGPNASTYGTLDTAQFRPTKKKKKKKKQKTSSDYMKCLLKQCEGINTKTDIKKKKKKMVVSE